jgi:hypothetical protein
MSKPLLSEALEEAKKNAPRKYARCDMCKNEWINDTLQYGVILCPECYVRGDRFALYLYEIDHESLHYKYPKAEIMKPKGS